jgi:DNA-binding MarR family transcriptional regulator
MAVKKTKQVTDASAPVVKPKSTHVPVTDSLDNLIHERARLALISALAAHNSLSFSELKELLQMTDGNLSVQARKLEEAGYISCEKSFVGRTPRTEFALTDSGRAALKRYVAHMEALIKSMKQG